MSISKLGPNKWAVKVSLRDTRKGYPIRKQAVVCGTRAEAVVAEGEILKELKARSLTSAHLSTFAHAADLYLEKLRVRGKLSKQYGDMVRYLRRELGHIRLEVFADHFEAYRRRIANTPTAQGKPRGVASINRYTAVVRAVFNHLVDLDIIPKSPIAKARFPASKEKARVRRLTQAERLRLLTAIGERRPYIAPIIGYMLAVPCRVGELVGAKREQYNPFTNTVYIPDSKADISIYKPVPVDMAAYFRGIPPDCPWLFYREVDGEYRQITRQVLRRAWEDCLELAGLSDYRLHDLRHEAATDLYIGGNSERMIMSVAGWKTPMLSRYWNLGGLDSAQKIVFGAPVSASEIGGGGEDYSAVAGFVK